MENFKEVYGKLFETGTPEAMKMLEGILCDFAEYVGKSNEKLYNDAVERMNAVNWNNYLTEREALHIVETLQGQDGQKGAKWSFAQVSDAVEKIGGQMECEPYYNKYALYIAVNMIYSDFAKTLAEYVEADRMFELVYRLAVDKLKDTDRPRFIRAYFGV